MKHGAIAKALSRYVHLTDSCVDCVLAFKGTLIITLTRLQLRDLPRILYSADTLPRHPSHYNGAGWLRARWTVEFIRCVSILEEDPTTTSTPWPTAQVLLRQHAPAAGTRRPIQGPF